MLSLILVVAIISFYPIKKIKKKRNKEFSENFFFFLFCGGCIFVALYSSMCSYIYFYDSVGTDIIYYEKNIQQLELELDELNTLIETTQSHSVLTEKETKIVLDELLGKKQELNNQIDLNTSKLNESLRYHNPKILKIAKFLIYFG